MSTGIHFGQTADHKKILPNRATCADPKSKSHIAYLLHFVKIQAGSMRSRMKQSVRWVFGRTTSRRHSAMEKLGRWTNRTDLICRMGSVTANVRYWFRNHSWTVTGNVNTLEATTRFGEYKRSGRSLECRGRRCAWGAMVGMKMRLMMIVVVMVMVVIRVVQVVAVSLGMVMCQITRPSAVRF